ncbi:TM2 domain-containing protein [Cryobacterium sp. N22]|uniref:TM2 domain-containing protein n=1 Tax=Cryobacterium sp. N22 TaxID=2048290 RepID=UPI000CE38163|nr:TM2 domain-containing protein [Cryobacterium sp. N22]
MSQPTVTQDPIVSTTPLRPQRSFVATWLFAWLLGGFGADRFYLGKIGTAVAKLLTLGGLGVWTLIDLIIVLAGKTTDKQGQPLIGYDQKKVLAWIITGVVAIGGGISGGVVAATTAATLAAISQPVVQELDDAAEAPADDAAEAPAGDAAVPGSTDAIAWADEQYGMFEATSQTGSGDSVISLPVDAAAGLVRATHDGSAYFSVQVVDAQSQPTLDLLVSTSGAYSGITAYGLDGDLGSPGVALQITADGPWSIAVGPISYSAALPTAGAGDDVFLYDGDAANLAFNHDGTSNFLVSEYTEGGYGMGLLVNEVGAYSGTVPISGGPSIIRVNADGNWGATQG